MAIFYQGRSLGPSYKGGCLTQIFGGCFHECMQSFGFPVRYSSQDSDDKRFCKKAIGASSNNAKSIQRFRSSSSRDKDKLGTSSILLQDGLTFQELPVLIRTTNKIPGIGLEEDRIIETDTYEAPTVESDTISRVIKTHLENINAVSEVLQYLHLIPSSDVTPLVSLLILERILAIYNLQEETVANPATSAILNTLSEIICRSTNADVTLSGLDAVNRCTALPSEEKLRYTNLFISECIGRANRGRLHLLQLHRFIEGLNMAGTNYQNLIDNLWSEILAREEEINLDNLNKIFSVLLHLKKSRKIILSMLEKKISNIYPMLNEKQIIHILQVICLGKLESRKICMIFATWTNFNIHRLTEVGLRDIISLFNLLCYNDKTLDRAIVRFVKAKGENLVDSMLVSALAQYAYQNRFFSPELLDSIATYFVKYSELLTTECITSMVEIFGYMNYSPSNDYEVFHALEDTLMERMNKFEPSDMIKILLSCTYLERFPLNFASMIFRPNYLDKINRLTDETKQNKAYKNLQLLDTALSLECQKYRGPFLPRNTSAKSLLRDRRLNYIQKSIQKEMADIVGGFDNFEASYVLPRLPLSDAYIIDYVLSLDQFRQPVEKYKRSGIDYRLAVLILLPESYLNCFDGTKRLIGSQSTKIRQLKLLGYEVATLCFATLDSLTSTPIKLDEYLKERLSSSIDFK